MPARTRSAALAALLASTVILTAPAAAPAEGLDDAGYWAIADAQVERLDRFWNEDQRAYRPGGGGADTMINAYLLLTHSVAAQQGHGGPARNDHRGRVVARRLVSSPPFLETQAPEGSQRHLPGWINSLDSSTHGQQHLVFDAPVVEALTAAWRAREPLGLSEETVRLIEDRIHRVATSAFYRWPAIRLNQVNWYALMYASAATVAGDTQLLSQDLAEQLRRFVDGIGRTARGAGNLGPGGRFHYLPHAPVDHRMNLDSAEYANIVVSVVRFLDQARAAGMQLALATRASLRDWATRTIAAYWTHAGYLNWDSGLGFERWHQSKKLGLSQEALLGIATDDTLGLPDRLRRWSKHVLDNGLRFYERLAQRTDDVAPGVFFGVGVVPQGPPAARLGASRIAANAARAVDGGLGRAPSAEPPALYSYDHDIGRLAVTTPHYNTAVVAVNQGAFPYGGTELARLYDGRQDVAANIGGRPPAAFGLDVRDGGGDRVLATQAGRRGAIGRAGVHLTRASASVHGRGSRLGTLRTGPFTDLRLAGRVAREDVVARTSHRFTPRAIHTTWRLRNRRPSRRLRAVAQFPSHGTEARVEALLRDGNRVPLGATPLRLSAVRALLVRSVHSGYRIDIRSAPRAAIVSARGVRRQPSAPAPGPTTTIRLADGRFRSLRLAVRITVSQALAAESGG